MTDETKTPAVHTPKTKEEFDLLLSKAKGSVVVDFTSEGCGACDPAVTAKIAEQCDTTTVVKVDLSGAPDDWQNELADQFDVEGTPTTLLADRALDFVPGKVEEIDPSKPEGLRRIKCAR